MIVDLFAAIGCYVVVRYVLRSWRNRRMTKRMARRRALVVLP
jgi:hypothetical protein